MKNSIKHLFIFLSIFGLSLSAQAASISVDVAQTVGANFLISKGVAGVNGTSDLTLAYTANAQANGTNIVTYYVFNAIGTKAFVMVSGDNNIIPILAYSNTSLFNYSKISPDAKYWIEGYKNQITAAISNNVPAKAGSAALWSELTDPVHTAHHAVTSTTAVAPLVQTTWDQYGVYQENNYGTIPPYNAYCPNTSTTGGLSVTGCVATAMSQVMKFWNWPTVGCGYHTYYDTYNSSEASGSNTWNSFDYANTAFNWAHMPLDSSNAAVATLMYAAGVSVNMSYSNAGSGAFVAFLESNGVNCAEYALQTYFHYKPSLHSVLRTGVEGSYLGQFDDYYHGSVNIDSLNEAAWISLLQTELNAGHPMLYDGQGSDGGHCWVCDGWETTDDMFHFNWGWSGYGPDGYYTVDDLSPPVLGAGGGGGNFNSDQGVIMGIVPDSFPTNVPGNIEMLAHLNTSTNIPLEYGNQFTITTKILNSGSSSFTGSFCVQLFDTAHNFITNLDTVTGVTITAGDSSAVLTFNCNSWALTSMVFNGISIAYQATGAGTWTTVANNGTFINYGTVGQLVDTSVALFDSLHVGSHTLQQGSPMTVTTKLGNNNGSGSINAAVEAILVNTATGSTFTVQSHTSSGISAGGTNYTFTNPDISVPAGLYALEIKHQYNGTGSYYTTSGDYYLNPILITITCAPNAGIISGTTAVCAGSSVTLSDTASGGSGTWSLSNSSIASVSGGVVTTTATGIDTVKYSLSNSCGTATSVAILDIEVLPTPAAISGLDTVCTGGTISMSDATTGGAWSTASSGIISVNTTGVVTGLSTGNDDVEYTVTNACGAGVVALPIYVSPTPFPSGGTISSTSSSVCLGGTIVLTDTADGGSGIWSSSNTSIASVSGGVVSGSTAGSATVMYSVTNSCGTGSSSIVVTFQTVPSAGAISGPDTVCIIGAGITLTETVAGGIWNVSNGNASISGGTVQGLTLGTDSVLYIVSNSCGADTAIATIIVSDCSTLVNSVTKQSDVINLYPNPAQDNITISSTGMINSVVISNVTGQEIFTQNYNTNKEVVVNLNQLSPGVYLVRINDTKVYKIVKQ